MATASEQTHVDKVIAFTWLDADLKTALKAVHWLETGRLPPVAIRNVTTSGQLVGDVGALEAITETLRSSGRLFQQGNTLVFLAGGRDASRKCQPTPLAVDGVITKTAGASLSNLVMCVAKKANSLRKGGLVDQPFEYEITYEVPHKVLQQVVLRDGFVEEIPSAENIVTHPVYDRDFTWLDAGYHPSQKILVCGEAIEPHDITPVVFPGEESAQSVQHVISRLPPLIRGWVRGFNWASGVDVINYVGAAMMVPLMPMLVDDGHPGVMFWGNQPGVGKSLAAQCLAILKDGQQASPTAVDGGAREVENQIASELNDGRTVLFLDNQKGSLNVPILEANITAAELAFRAFHVQKKIRRPNVILWLITTNDATPSEDMLSRCVHVRLHYEGVPDTKAFEQSEQELVDYVRSNRLPIIAELAGMIRSWLDAGRPTASAPCRFGVFGRVAGGVLMHWGLSGFLSNTRDEVLAHSEKHQQLIALAERLIDSRESGFVLAVQAIEDAEAFFRQSSRPVSPKEAKDWVHMLTGAGAIPATCDTPQKQKMSVTRYMASIVKVPVEVVVGENAFRVMMVSRSLGSRRSAYVLAVEGLPLESEAAGMPVGKSVDSKVGAEGPCDACTSSPTGEVIPPEADKPPDAGLWA